MATTWYVWINPLQEADNDMGLDDQHRPMYGFNISAERYPDPTTPGDFEDELVKILNTAGVGTFSTNIFVGAAALLPSGVGPYLTVISTGGISPEETQNTAAKYRRPTAQICVHATDGVAAKTMAKAAYSAFVKIRNKAI